MALSNFATVKKLLYFVVDSVKYAAIHFSYALEAASKHEGEASKSRGDGGFWAWVGRVETLRCNISCC